MNVWTKFPSLRHTFFLISILSIASITRKKNKPTTGKQIAVDIITYYNKYPTKKINKNPLITITMRHIKIIQCCGPVNQSKAN